jgi:MFS family permease
MIRDYFHHAARFPTAAKLFLAGEFLAGIGQGTIWVLRNLYLEDLGFKVGFIGQSLAASTLGMALVAVPLSFTMDRRPLKGYLVAGALALGAGVAGTALWPTKVSVLAWGFVSGSGIALLTVGSVPFYMRHSTPAERPFLFGAGTALSPASGLVGTALVWVLAHAWGDKAPGMRKMMLVSAAIAAAGAVVFAVIREHPAPARTGPRLEFDRRTAFRICLPLVIIGLGAGLTIPMINLYFNKRFHYGAGTISAFFSVAQVLTFVAFLASPLLARRYGGVRTVVACQMLSIPFFLVMAFTGSPALAVGAFFARHALMNMAGPVTSQFAMEVVPAHHRALTNGFREISWNFTFMFGTIIGGWIIDNASLLGDGFTVTMLGTIGLYLVGSLLFYAYWRKSPVLKPGVKPAPLEPVEVAP